MSPFGRRRGLGLLGAAAVGGTAYYAGSRMAKGSAREESQNQQIADLQAQQASTQYQQPAQPAPAAAPLGTSQDEKIAQLQKLGELKAAGVLTQAEFEAQKAKILAG